MDWFRSHHGAPIDPKLAVVARRAGCRRGEVAAVWWCVLDCASQNVTRGDASNFDIEAFSVTLDFEQDLVERIVKAMCDKGMLVDGMRVAAWEKRQVKREDSSAERTRKYRDAQKRDVTRGDARREEKREEEKEVKPTARKRADDLPFGFNEFWQAYPRKTAKPAAIKAYRRSLAKGVTPGQILVGLETYKRTKPEYADWCHPATFLNDERYNDEPSAAGSGKANGASSDGLARPIDGHDRVRRWLKDWRPGKPWPREVLMTAHPGHPDCTIPQHILAEFGFTKDAA